jgi:hypothetical protein
MMNAIDLAVQKGADNRNAVWNFFRDNPCHTQSECSKQLGMSAKTVGAHCKAIRGGWRPISAPFLGSFDNVSSNDILSCLEYFKTADVDPQVLGHYKSEAFRRGLIS